MDRITSKKCTIYLENRDQLIRHIEGTINYNCKK